MDGKSVVFRHSFPVEGGDFIRGGEASCQILQILKELGLKPSLVRRAGIAAYEAEMNIVMYAVRGELRLVVTPNCIEIVAADAGPGIPDLNLAMKEGYSTATEQMREMGFGAGMGLPNIKRNSDSMQLTSEVNEGTKVRVRIKLNPNGGASEASGTCSED